MSGVVLWSNENQQKAVIWCEDQGDLAFYLQEQCQALVDLHEGDVICFDLTLPQNRRMVVNPMVLEEEKCTGLVESLFAAQTKVAASLRPTQHSAQILPFKTKFSSVEDNFEKVLSRRST